MKPNVRISTLALALATLGGNLTLLPSAQGGSWTNTGAMQTPRAGHTATLLPNGKVLVAGGTTNSSAAFSSVELYDPSTGTWTPTSPMLAARCAHTATLLPNGKVLVAGGWSSYSPVISSYSSAELYDPATETWTPTGSMSVRRFWYRATLLPNGKVLVSGGYNGNNYSSAELYNPGTGLWTPTGSMSVDRSDYAATLLDSGKVLVTGGWYKLYPHVSKSVESYDPTNGAWTATGSLVVGREYHTATLLKNGNVLVAGGEGVSGSYLSETELFNPTTGVWILTNAMSASRFQHVAEVLRNGNVLVAGGLNASGVLSSAELFDPVTGTWMTTSSMSYARNAFTATLLPNGKVLVAGGSSSPVAELFESDLPLQITTQPQSQLGYWGKSVSFSVAVTNGTPPYAYQWRKGGVDISDATNSVLTLTNLQLADAGTYTVLVSDTVTNLISQPATLTVNPAGVGIALYAGVTIDGVAGQTYGVQSTLDLSNTNSWVGRANVTLTNATQLWYDSQPATQPQTYYRVVPGPISIP